MKNFFVLAFIVGITGFVLSSEDVSKPLNFIVFVDDETEPTLNQIKLAKKYLTSIGGDSTNIGKVEVMPIGNYNTTTFDKFIETKLKKWEKAEENPTFAFDFTQRSYSSHLAKMYSRRHSFPMISTNVQQNALTGRVEVDTNLNFTVQLRSPEKIIEEFAAMVSSFTLARSCFVVGKTVKHFRTDKKPFDARYQLPKNAFFKESELSMISADPSVKIPAFIASRRIHNIFTFGTTEELLSLFKSASKQNLFNEDHAWIAVVSEIGGNFQLPKSMNALLVLSPESNRTDFGKIMKHLNTKNIMDLFYVDVLVATIKTIQTMKKNNVWKDGNYKLDLRTPLTKYMEEGNGTIFGKYFQSKITEQEDFYHQSKRFPSHIWNPDRQTFKLELIKSGNSSLVGTLRFIGDRTIEDITNPDAYFGYFRSPPLRATLVVDPPFVIKNDTCITAENRKKNGSTNNCYTGYVMDIFNKIYRDLFFDWEIKSEDTYGEKQENGKWTGARGSLSVMQNKKRDVDIGIGAFTVYDEHDERGPEFSIESEPFYYDKERKAYYGFAFGGATLRSGSKYREAFNLAILKLKNQRYLEHLRYHWIHGSSNQPNTSSKH